jgi:outer membrane protein assembly factor BamB
LRIRIGMGIALLAGVALLGAAVLRSVLPLSEAAKGSLPPQIHYPLTLTVVDGVVYLAPSVFYSSSATTATIAALRADNGSLLWSRTFPRDYRTYFQLTVANGFVYIRTVEDSLEVLRATDGSQLWQYTAPTPFYSTVANGMVYVLTQEGQLFALRASSGSRSWAYTSSTPAEPLSPVVADGMVFLGLQDGDMDVVRAETGALLWRYRPHVPALVLFPQPFVANGVAYVPTQDGHLFALRASTGSPVWSRGLHVSNFPPFLFLVGGVIYVETPDGGNIAALRASDGSVLWHYQGGEVGLVSVTVAQSVVYLAFPGRPGPIGSITALRASDGSTLWRYSPPIPATQLIPALTGSLVLIALQDGSVTTLSASSGSLRWHRYVDG